MSYKKKSYTTKTLFGIRLVAVNRFQELDSLTGLFASYLSVFEYDIRYLEMLYTGRCFDSENLHQRIKKLISYSPEIESLFVPKNGNEYYLIFELEKANNYAEDGDEIRLNDKLTDCFSLSYQLSWSSICSN